MLNVPVMYNRKPMRRWSLGSRNEYRSMLESFRDIVVQDDVPSSEQYSSFKNYIVEGGVVMGGKFV